MKKIYYTPSISVIDIEEEQIIAGSSTDKSFSGAPESTGGFEADAAAYRNNLWE